MKIELTRDNVRLLLSALDDYKRESIRLAKRPGAICPDALMRCADSASELKKSLNEQLRDNLFAEMLRM